MTKEEKNELEQEMKNLKFLLEFHSTEKLIKDESEFEEYINAVLDRIAEIERKLKK
jgi:lysyl-tRNA synthetase class I